MKHGEMKASLENVFYEIVEPDERGVGDLVVTTLTNDFMPLVRYRVGDLVERREQPYATNYFVHGRSRDALRRRDGRRVTTLEIDQCFAEAAGIAHYQLRQKESGECHLQFIPDRERAGRGGIEPYRRAHRKLAPAANRILPEAVKMLPPLTSGKFRLTCRA